MSILYTSDKGWVISHYDYSKNLYRNVLSQSGRVDLAYSDHIFNIMTPLMKDQEAQKVFETMYVESSCSQTVSKLIKRPFIEAEVDVEIPFVQNAYQDLIREAKRLGYFNRVPSKGDLLENNAVARNFVNRFLEQEGDCTKCLEGGNTSDDSLIVLIDKKEYIIPPHSFFILSDINKCYQKLKDKKYDFILLDPPWKNKFIRRKKRKCIKKGYEMMENDTISDIPINTLLSHSGLVGIWCTNSIRHMEDVKNLFFPKWGLEYVSTWFWVKVTSCGEAVCSFSNSSGKKPYERIIFGCRPKRNLRNPEEQRCILSVPSALHSHKPPLTDVLNEYLPENPQCLELFARYLLPGWTSVGNQVILLQSLMLFDERSNKSGV